MKGLKMKDKVKHSKKVKQKSGFVKAVNKIMPYILSVFAAFVLFSLSNLAGHFGGNIKAFLYGTFSNFATYFLPIFLIYHAIMWNYDVKKGICVRRVVCSIITLPFICLFSIFNNLYFGYAVFFEKC